MWRDRFHIILVEGSANKIDKKMCNGPNQIDIHFSVMQLFDSGGPGLWGLSFGNSHLELGMWPCELRDLVSKE